MAEILINFALNWCNCFASKDTVLTKMTAEILIMKSNIFLFFMNNCTKYDSGAILSNLTSSADINTADMIFVSSDEGDFYFGS